MRYLHLKQSLYLYGAFRRLFSCTVFLLLIACLCSVSLSAQYALPLNDLTAFPKPGTSWNIVGDVTADLNQNNVLNTVKGTGILVNLPDSKKGGADLLTAMQHGDIDLELDYMMAKGSNSGIYLQGRYEVQLMDSWKVLQPKFGANGGIYERWDETKPEGQKGFEGYAPRQNVSRAPGLWQHIKISFQAPRFDSLSGHKIQNARILLVELNGVVIQEDVELTGPTRGGITGEETALGPLRLQGDHGPVAFRNIRITPYDKPRPQLLNLTYKIYKGKYQEVEPDYKKLPPEAAGTSVILTSNVSKIPNEYLVRYTGTLRIKEPGTYIFKLNTSGGRGLIRINNQMLLTLSEGSGKKSERLPAGDLPFELLYSKFISYDKSGFGLTVAGPGIREDLLSDVSIDSNIPVDPILVPAPVNTILRSFMDLPGGERVMHGVNVGSPRQVHYMYDMDHAMIVQLWRGGFLDATPMWNGRGDGSSRPVGSVLYFGAPVMALSKLSSLQDAWLMDTTGAGYRAKGYVLDKSSQPTFRYQIYGVAIEDATKVLEGGEGIQREISVQHPSPGLYIRLADAKKIESLSDGLYLIDDKTYYLRIDSAGGAKPVVREMNGRKELLLPVQNGLTYSILF